MLLIAHGGYSSKYPENSQIAYKKALDYMPEGLEMDVVFYKGEVYFYHPIGNKVSFGEGVDKLIEEQLEKLLKEGKKILSFNDTEILHSYLSKTDFICLDIKQKSLQYSLNIFEKIRGLKLSKDQIYVCVRDLNRVREFNKVNPLVTYVSLDQDPNTFKQYIDNGVEYIRLWYKDVTDDLLSEIKDYGGKVIVNHKMKVENSIAREAGNFSAEILNELENKGIDGVLINDIKLGRRLFPVL